MTLVPSDLKYWTTQQGSIKLNALPMGKLETQLMEVWGIYAKLLVLVYHGSYSVNNLWAMYLIEITEYYTSF